MRLAATVTGRSGGAWPGIPPGGCVFLLRSAVLRQRWGLCDPFPSAGYPVVFEHGRSHRFLRWNVSYLNPGRTQVVYAVFTVGR